MWFNVALSIFLIISFLVTWSGIGTVIKNQNAIVDILKNVYKLLEINGDAWKKQLDFNKIVQSNRVSDATNAIAQELSDFLDKLLSTDIPDEKNSEAAKKNKKEKKK